MSVNRVVKEIHKCDRCGKEFDKIELENHRRLQNNEVIFNNMEIILSSKGYDGAWGGASHKYNDYWLCNDCTQGLSDYLDGEK